jgi:hypothetical protein
MPDAATKSLTVLETSTSSAAALAMTRVPIWTAIPPTVSPTSSHSPAWRPALTSRPSVRTAHCFMEAVIDNVWKVVAAGREVAIEQRATLRLAAVDGVQRAVEAVDLVFNAAGATSIHTSSPLERCFRDIHVVPAHFVVQPPIYEAAGRVMLEMPSGMPLFLIWASQRPSYRSPHIGRWLRCAWVLTPSRFLCISAHNGGHIKRR